MKAGLLSLMIIGLLAIGASAAADDNVVSLALGTQVVAPVATQPASIVPVRWYAPPVYWGTPYRYYGYRTYYYPGPYYYEPGVVHLTRPYYYNYYYRPRRAYMY